MPSRPAAAITPPPAKASFDGRLSTIKSTDEPIKQHPPVRSLLLIQAILLGLASREVEILPDTTPMKVLYFLDLEGVEFDWGFAAKHVDENFELALGSVNLVD